MTLYQACHANTTPPASAQVGDPKEWSFAAVELTDAAAPIVCEEIEHSEHGASIAKRFTNCHGSVRLCRTVPPGATTPQAERGTALHEVASLCLNNGQDAIEYVGRTVNAIEIDEAAAEEVQLYLDHCRTRPDDATRFVEKRFSLEALRPPAPMFGTADHVAYRDGTLWVDDLKTGYLEVAAEGNIQLRYYALGAMLSVHPLPVDRVVAAIVQPKRRGVKPAEFDAFDLMEWSGELIGHVAATLEPDAPATAGPWCRDTFCPAAGVCPAYAAYALEIAKADFDAPIYAPPAPETLTSAEIGRMKTLFPAVKSWMDAVDSEVERRARLGDKETGWQVVETEGREAWKDKSITTARIIAESARISAHALIAPPEPVSPAQARGVLASAAIAAAAIDGEKLTKKAAESAARVILAPFISRPVGSAVVPMTDSRPALAGPGAEFSAMPAE